MRADSNARLGIYSLHSGLPTRVQPGHSATAGVFFKKSGPKTVGNTLEVPEMERTQFSEVIRTQELLLTPSESKVMKILVFFMAASPTACLCRLWSLNGVIVEPLL